MIRSLWIAKTGMEAQQTQLDNISHNLANVATNGYKRSHAVFEDLIYQNLRRVGSNSSDSGSIVPSARMAYRGSPRALSTCIWPMREAETGSSESMRLLLATTRVPGGRAF